MRIAIKGLDSSYQTENVARIFFPAARPSAKTDKGDDVVYARLGRRTAALCLRKEGAITVKRFALTDLPGGKTLRGEALGADERLAAALYRFLKQQTGRQPPWGMMTGVRPVRIIHDARRLGRTEKEIEDLFLGQYDCTPGRFALAQQIAGLQRPYVEAAGERDCSVYLGIPFCPSRCSYCSFVSSAVEREKSLVEPYVEALCREVENIAAVIRENRLRLKTVYIGGGTPTALSLSQLEKLLDAAEQHLAPRTLEEYTVEAGRPDCTDAAKLRLLKEAGVSRISINPQTFSDEVLRGIGRRHTAQDIVRCYEEARRAGHACINMDLIAGLPGDTEAGFAASLRQALALAPENITVHTLTLKRASSLVKAGEGGAEESVEAMLRHCEALGLAGYEPYYLYRQKGTLQNLENTGWARPGTMGLYNIYIMEEVHTILAGGAGASTKLVHRPSGRIERIFNYKYPQEYLKGFDACLAKKKGVTDFYASHLDPETPC